MKRKNSAAHYQNKNILSSILHLVIWMEFVLLLLKDKVNKYTPMNFLYFNGYLTGIESLFLGFLKEDLLIFL